LKKPLQETPKPVQAAAVNKTQASTKVENKKVLQIKPEAQGKPTSQNAEAADKFKGKNPNVG
jgi:hypothetical protein